MQALILAGGKGTRLKPYTTSIPKPLMPVGDMPILEIILRQLKHAGISDVILAVGHMSHLIQAFFQDGERFGLRISYSFETEPLGTAGPIGLVLDRLADDFLVMNGDLLTTLDYGVLIEHHLASKAAATIGTYAREVKIDFGVLEHDEKGQLQRYIEKPVYHFDVSMGVNVLNKTKIAKYVANGAYLDIPDLMMKLRGDGQSVLCFKKPCYWLDIGRIEDYEIASEEFEKRRAEFLRA